MVGMNRLSRSLLRVFASLAFGLAALPAVAQEAPAQDWVLTQVREQDAVVAAAPFSNGITVVARCSDNVFALILMGLPEADRSATTRRLILLVGDETRERPYSWSVASDRSAAFSRVPALTARQLMKGGKLQIIVPGEPGGRRTRYVMSVRPSESALQDVLSRCGRPIVDPRDDLLLGDGQGLPEGLHWVTQPRPTAPGSNVHRAATGGSVTLSCTIGAGGRLTDCEVEDEFPHGANLAQAVSRSTDAARVGQTERSREAGESFEGRRVVFTVNFVFPH
jgi:hypothetical protein